MKRSPAQEELVKKYYRGYIPHITILDKAGKAIYNSAGEIGEPEISAILDQALK